MPLLGADNDHVQFLAEYINPGTTVTSVIVGNGLTMACGGPSISEIKSYLVNQGREGGATRDLVATELIKSERVAQSVLAFGRQNNSDSIIECATLEELCSCLEPIIGKSEVISRFSKALAPGGPLLPGIGHEVIAHLTHHGLINHIVDFNFDQLLQTALLEELGHDKFSIYRNEADFSGLVREMNTGNQLKPTLIKPHGGFPQDDAIRITTGYVGAYPPRTYEVLRKIIERSNVLIIIGYSASDPDFQAQVKHLDKHTLREKKIVWVEKNTQLPSSVSSALETLGRILTPVTLHGRHTHLFVGIDANEFLEVLGRKCAQEHSIPNVTRQGIRTSILSNVAVSRRAEAKFMVEVLILAAKLRGFLNLEEISSCARLEATVRERTQTTAPGLKAASLLKLLVDEGFLAPIDKSSRRYLSNPIQFGQQIEDLFNGHGWLRSSLDVPRLNREFQSLSEECDIDVDADKDLLIGIDFLGATPICSMRDLIAQTRRIIEEKSALRISTFRGKWLTSKKWAPSLIKSTAQVLILGHSLYPDEVGHDTFYEKRQAQTINTLRSCNAYKLKRNMDNAFKYCATINPQVGAIIFHRKIGSPIISPYLLPPGDALKGLIHNFDQAWNCGLPMEGLDNSKEGIRGIVRESVSQLGVTPPQETPMSQK